VISEILSILIVLALFIFGYFGFGLFLISKLKLKFSFLEKGVLATLLSVSFVTSVIALLGQFLGSNSYYLLIFTTLVGITQYSKIRSYSKNLIKMIGNNKLGTLFLIVCIFILSSTISFSGFMRDGSLVLQETHDSVWHIALIENLEESIPPAHPSDPSIILNNYHYFYDLFLAGFSKFSNTSLFVLYYQFSVVFLTSILVLSAYILGNKLNGKLAGYYLVGFTAFVGSFAYLIPYFNPGQMWHESSFWVSQTLVMIVNPQIIYTLAVTYGFIFLLIKLNALTPKKPFYFQLHALVMVLAATSMGFKSYSWPILTSIYGFFLLIELIRHKSVKTIVVGLLYLGLSTPIVWLITHFNGNSFFYEPLWYTDSMIESPDRVNYLEWKFLQDHYLFKKNWPRFYIIEVQKIAIFYFGNLGIRSLFIGLPILLFFKKSKKFVSSKKQLLPIISYVFFGFLFSSIFPLLFLQKGTVWNSIQFWYYTLIFANILVVIFLSEILKKKSNLLIGVVTVILIAVAVPTSIKTIKDKNANPDTFEKEEMAYLKSKASEDVIMICPGGTQLYKTSLVKTVTPAQVYLANPSQLELVGSDLKTQEVFEKIVDDSRTTELAELISANKITIILCRDRDITNRFSKMLKVEPKLVGSLNVFEL
jgi:hypothetical protein